jgi:hypothetical protein
MPTGWRRFLRAAEALRFAGNGDFFYLRGHCCIAKSCWIVRLQVRSRSPECPQTEAETNTAVLATKKKENA